MAINGIKCVLLDIEGTICSISFVKETLFPYALQALPSVLETQWDSPSLRPYIDAFPSEHRTSPSALQAHVEDLTARDVKIAYLKNLQGYLWADGYASGAYSTPLFEDVVGSLEAWKGEGRQVAIYSSGSVYAQKLLFQYVKVGEDKTKDLMVLVEGWFDTVNAGLKGDAESYTKIAGSLKKEPNEVLFLSDNVHEVDAAIKAGMKSILIDRPGNASVSAEDRERLQVCTSLSEIKLSS